MNRLRIGIIENNKKISCSSTEDKSPSLLRRSLHLLGWGTNKKVRCTVIICISCKSYRTAKASIALGTGVIEGEEKFPCDPAEDESLPGSTDKEIRYSIAIHIPY